MTHAASSEGAVAFQVLPGLVDLSDSRDSDVIYPAGTLDFVASLRALGAQVVAGPEGREVELRAGDWWLPLLAIASDVSVQAAGNLLAEAILRLVGRDRRSTSGVVRLKVTRLTPKEAVVIDLEASPADAVALLRNLSD